MPPRKSVTRSSKTSKKNSPLSNVLVIEEDTSAFGTLSDCVIEGILFTGYIEKTSVLGLLTISHRIHKIGNNAIRYLDLRSLNKISNSIVKIPKVAINLMSLDLSYSQLDESFTGSELTCLQSSLRGLSLRGTSVGDNCLESLSKLTELIYLDISKSQKSQVKNITDIGVKKLCTLKNLNWLSVGWTSITDSSIHSICQNLTKLQHLGISFCYLITNACFTEIQKLKLITLDVSSCKKLSNKFMDRLCEDTAPISASLRNVLCSYIPSLTSKALLKLLENSSVTKLECRGGERVSDEVRELAVDTLEVAIFDHSDQFDYLNTPYTLESMVPHEHLCLTHTWPYNTSLSVQYC
mmetsp:Transcript_34843/g.33145  ORF Transcript_34843/g.33145 Transcript_34843/m.33145 type:complete len:352 (+) Transcript_34843:65-1120(+)